MRIVVLGALTFLLAFSLCAQIDNGNITGRVIDPTGAAIAGAQVTLTDTDTNFQSKATANEEGIYRALNLRPGPYKIEFVANGFKKLLRENVELRVNSTLAVNAKLEVGAVTDSVEVTAKSQLLDTETSSTGTAMEGDYFYNLPNYQRHAVAALLFTPGVSFSSNQYTKTIPNLDGLGAGVIGYFEDGALTTFEGRGNGNAETVNNAIEDMKVFTSAMPAEYGHSAGVGISIVKKSGTNQFHGLASQEFRTASMQHRRFFQEYGNTQIQPGWSTKPGLIVINPDANLSGPVYIPHLYNGKNKTFFFVGWQMMIEKQGKQGLSTVPTPQMMSGDFRLLESGLVGNGITANVVYDPLTTRQVNGQWFRDPFPNNIVPTNRWDKVATTVLGFNPLRGPNVVGSWTNSGPSNNLQLGPMKITKWNNVTGRLDHQVSTKIKLFATYTFNHEWGRTPCYACTVNWLDSTFNLGVVNHNTFSIGSTWVPSPTVVNDFRATYYADASLNSSIALNNDYATKIGLGGKGFSTSCLPGVIPSFFTDFGGGSLSPGCGSRTINETFTYKDDLSKSWGAHNFKFGYELMRYHLNSTDPGTPDGTFSYAGTGGLTTTGGGVSNTGQTLAGFMIGAMSGYSFTERMNSDLTRSWQHSFYAQDDWKVSSKLTVNFGVRYNIEPPKHEKYGFISLFNLNIPDNETITSTAYQNFCPAGGCMGAYQHPVGTPPFHTQYDRWDPVVGLSWNFMNHMVLRAGARIAHTDTRTDGTSLLYTNEMITDTYSASQVSGNNNPLFMLDNGVPSWSYPVRRADGSVPTTNTNPGSVAPSIVSQNLHTPYVTTWNVSIQRELSRDYLLELRYEGAAQVGGYGTYDINTRPWGTIPCAPSNVNAGPVCTGTVNLNDPANAAFRYSWTSGSYTAYTTQMGKPYPNLGSINIVGNVYHMDRQAGVVSISKRFSRGVNFQAFYQYSKALGGGAGNPYLNWGLFKAVTGNDQRHNLTGTLNYDIPFGKGRHWMNHSNRVLDTILGGYQFMWTYTITTGNPAGLGLSSVSLTNFVAGSNTYHNIGPPQYPSYMPNYGGVLMLQVPKMRNDWQDIGGDRWTVTNENSMIDCGTAVINNASDTGMGNSCFTFMRPYSLGNNGSNLWSNQRLIIANASLQKEVPLKGERFRLKLRLDFQNPFHWFNWGGPTTTLTVNSLAATKSFGTDGGSGESGTGTAGYGGTPLLNMNVALSW